MRKTTYSCIDNLSGGTAIAMMSLTPRLLPVSIRGLYVRHHYRCRKNRQHQYSIRTYCCDWLSVSKIAFCDHDIVAIESWYTVIEIAKYLPRSWHIWRNAYMPLKPSVKHYRNNVNILFPISSSLRQNGAHLPTQSMFTKYPGIQTLQIHPVNCTYFVTVALLEHHTFENLLVNCD